MVIYIIHKLVRAILFIFIFSISTKIVISLNIVSPSDGSVFVFGNSIPVNVINSDTDTATIYTATFVCTAGTYQLTGLSLGINYELIPAGLHGLANLIITAAGGTTAVANIQITGPVPPTPNPTPFFAPTICGPQTIYPFPCHDETECPNPCYPKPNKACDEPNNSLSEHSNFCDPNENKRRGSAQNLRSSARRHDRAKLSQYSSFELNRTIPRKFYSPIA